MGLPDYYVPEILKEIDCSNMNDSLFNLLCPSVEAHAKKINEYLKDERSE